MSPLATTSAGASSKAYGLFSAPLPNIKFLASIGGVANLATNAISVGYDGNIAIRGADKTNLRDMIFAISPSGDVLKAQAYWTFTGGNTFSNMSIWRDASGNMITSSNANNNIGQGVFGSFASNGVFQWGVFISGLSNTDQPLQTFLAPSGNIYVTSYAGYNQGTYSEIFKFNSAGAVQWQRKVNAGRSQQGTYGLAVAPSTENIYITGTSYDGTWSRPTMFKYNSSGTIQWKIESGNLNATCYNTRPGIDSSENVYFTASDGTSLNIVKVNSSGTVQWNRKLNVNVAYTAIATDASGNSYVLAVGGPAYVVKYDTNGTIQWQRQFTRTGQSWGVAETGAGIHLDNQGNLLIAAHDATGFIAKVPTDGTLTGSYTVGANTYTYAASSLTDSAGGLTYSAVTGNEAASTASVGNTSSWSPIMTYPSSYTLTTKTIP